MRLNKFIAHSGIASRRKADALIEKGKVLVNGEVAGIGYDVKEGDRVQVDGHEIHPEKRMIYYMLNKPVGYITSVSDEYDRPTVLDLMPDIRERIYPVGRLDYNTSGLLLITNDGDLANRLMHPSKDVTKTYVARVRGLFTYREAGILEQGVDIGDDHRTLPAEVEILRQSNSSSTVQIKIREGRNHQVRRMFSAVGHDVQELERIALGNLTMAHLKPGMFRKLSENEIRYLKSL